MEITTEKSEAQGEVIKTLALIATGLDKDYLKECAKAFMDQAHRQESLSVLNPSHLQSKNELLRLNGKALFHLTDYLECLEKIQEQKKTITHEEARQSDIASLFM